MATTQVPPPGFQAGGTVQHLPPGPGMPAATTPQAFAGWLNANINHGGKPIPGLPGATLGDQWLSWYAQKHAALGDQFTLQDYEDSFLVFLQFDVTGVDLGAFAAGSVTGTGVAVNSIIPGLNPLSWLSAIGDFFHRLTEGSTWIRLGEGLLGIVLISVGIARLTHAVPVATKIARTAGAVAVL